MENKGLITSVRERASQWLTDLYEPETRNKVKDLMKNNESELIECFYRDLEFGTGGLRGIMGVGTNRMNIYTIGMAAQGLANYMKKSFEDIENTNLKNRRARGRETGGSCRDHKG